MPDKGQHKSWKGAALLSAPQTWLQVINARQVAHNSPWKTIIKDRWSRVKFYFCREIFAETEKKEEDGEYEQRFNPEEKQSGQSDQQKTKR